MKTICFRCLSLFLCVIFSLAVCNTALAEGYTRVIALRYDGAGSFREGLAAVKTGEKWGFIDQKGQEVVPPKYDDVHHFREGFAAVCMGDWKTGKWGFIDRTGKEIVPPKYDDAYAFCEGLALVLLEDQFGFIDTAGHEIVPPKYDDAFAFREGLAKVWIAGGEDRSPWAAGKWGYIDKTGHEVVPVIYEQAGAFHEGLACVVKDGMMGFVDETGAVVIPLIYHYERPFNGIYAAYEGDILPFFSEGLAALWGMDGQGGLYGYIDQEGKVVIPFTYDYAGPFSEGLAYVSKGASIWYENDEENNEDGKFGYINKAGEVIVPLEYDCDYVGHGTLYNWRFVDGYAQVSQKGTSRWDVKYGLVDQTGNVVVPIRYHWMERMVGELSFAGYGVDYSGHGYWTSIGLVDATGEEIVAVDFYAWIDDFSEGYACVRYGGEAGDGLASEESRYGFIDMAGNEVVPCIFQYAGSFSEGMAAVHLDGKWGYIAIDQ